MQKLVIRPMRPKDAPAIAKMMRALAAVHGDKAKATAGHFVTYCLGPQKLAEVLVALVKNKPAGFALTYDRMNFVRGKITRVLDLLFVEEAHRHKGIGRGLIAAVVRNMLSEGHARLAIGAAETNPASNLFYQGLGLTPRTDKAKQYVIQGTALKRFAKLDQPRPARR